MQCQLKNLPAEQHDQHIVITLPREIDITFNALLATWSTPAPAWTP